MDVTGRLSDAIHWDYYQPGTNVLTDNCTTAIRPAAKDALSGILRVLQNLQNRKIQLYNILIFNHSLFESIDKNGVLQHPQGYRKSNPFLKSCRLRRGIENLILF